MMQGLAKSHQHGHWIVICLCGLAMATSALAPIHADPPPAEPATVPAIWTREAAVRWALENNPEIATVRRQHGVAAAVVIIAQTYPFNPIWTNKLFANNGPESAGITSRVAMEQGVALDLEIRGQGKYRRQVACAALSRTDWEIAYQEQLLARRALSAFNTLLYRKGKLRLLQETVDLDKQTVEQVEAWRTAKKATPGDLIAAQTEVDDALAQVGTGRAMLAVAESDLRRVLGIVDGAVAVEGVLNAPETALDAEALTQSALAQRADLQARKAALAEAEARHRLTVADRFGNPNFRPDYEYNETRVNFIGAQLTLPLPIFNTRRGEIMQRQEERGLAGASLRQTEIFIQQDVQAALSRLHSARALVATYQKEVLPHLRDAKKRLEALVKSNDANVLAVIDVQRKLIKARNADLDALFELSQAQVDLAAAVGDPGQAMAP